MALSGERPWTYLDVCLWHTCEALTDLCEGRLHERPVVPTYARLAPGEHVLAVGPAHRLTWGAVGNGSYVHSSVVAVGRPAFVLGSMLGNAMGNASRRKAALAAAQPRWHLDGPGGELTITDQGAYFGHPRAPASMYWGYAAVRNIDLTGPEEFEITYTDTRNVTSPIRLRTPWASLMFVLAARAGFTAHPRFLSRGWLPPDFEDHCARMGYPRPRIPPLPSDVPFR